VYPSADEELREALQEYVGHLAAVAVATQQPSTEGEEEEAASRDPPHPFIFTKHRTYARLPHSRDVLRVGRFMSMQ